MLDLVVCDVDLPWHALLQLTAFQVAFADPFEDGLRRDPEKSRCSMDGIDAIAPSRRVWIFPVDLDRRNGPTGT